MNKVTKKNTPGKQVTGKQVTAFTCTWIIFRCTLVAQNIGSRSQSSVLLGRFVQFFKKKQRKGESIDHNTSVTTDDCLIYTVLSVIDSRAFRPDCK